MNALEDFHPLVAQWFRTRIGDPTELQARAWPVIAAGRHVLVTAPTGSGKTLTAFLRLQKEATGCPLPHRHHLLVEAISAGPHGYPGNQIVIHTLWGGRVNRPFAMALEAAWEGRFGQKIEIYGSNDCVLLQLPHDLSGAEVLSLVTPARVRDILSIM